MRHEATGAAGSAVVLVGLVASVASGADFGPTPGDPAGPAARALPAPARALPAAAHPLPSDTPTSTPTLDVVGPADFDWALEGLDGDRFRLRRFRGRVLFLNFWATWCRPCVEELGSIARLADSLEETGVVFLLVSPERAGHVRDFLLRHDIEVPAAVEVERMPPAFGLRAVPSTWIVDAEGRIVLQHRGAAAWDRKEVRDFLVWLERSRSGREGGNGQDGRAGRDPDGSTSAGQP